MPRLWFTDGISAKDPAEIVAANATATLSGWWKSHIAGDPNGDGSTDEFTIERWTTGRGPDNKYYITQWDDSSGNDNHLLDLGVSTGPQVYGSDADNEGSSSDEVNGYCAADFKGGIDGSLNLFLRTDPDTDEDFVVGDANAHLNFICVVRHNIATNQSGASAGDWGFIAAADIENTLANWAFGTIIPSVVGTIEVYTQLSMHTSEEYSTGTTILAEDQWYILGFFSDSEDGNNDPLIGMLTPDDGAAALQDVGTAVASPAGTGQTGVDALYVGRRNAALSTPDTFNGRMAEMAIIKSTDPLSRTERIQLVQYYKNKFAL